MNIFISGSKHAMRLRFAMRKASILKRIDGNFVPECCRGEMSLSDYLSPGDPQAVAMCADDTTVIFDYRGVDAWGPAYEPGGACAGSRQHPRKCHEAGPFQ